MNRKEILQPPNTEPRFFYGYIVVIAAFIILLVSFGVLHSFGVFFKPILTEFDWTRAATSSAFSLAFIVQGILGIIMGGLNDRFGSRILMTFCGILLALGYVLMSQINTIGQLYLFYGVIIGVGMAGVYIPILSTVARWFVKRRSLMTGIVLAGLAAGTFTMPPIINWLIYTYDWRMSFIIVGILILVVVVIAAQFLRINPGQIRQLPDGKEPSRQELESVREGFSLRESIRTRQFWIAFTILFCLAFYIFVITVHIVPYATDIGISATNAANILATFGGLGIVGRVVSGFVADRVGNRKVLIIGFALILASSFLLVLPATELWVLYIYAAVLGFASSGTGALASPLIADLFGMRSHGLIFGIVGSGYTIGGASGPIVAAYTFDTMGSYRVSFLVCAALSALGLLLAIIIRPTRSSQEIRT